MVDMQTHTDNLQKIPHKRKDDKSKIKRKKMINVIEYEQYALELQGLEENITELRDSL